METAEKPQISILMAVYEPRLDWLKEQLRSLNAQDYPNLILYVRDDASKSVPLDVIQETIQECITRFPFELARNDVNLGSNATFERLTQDADGYYFAYCDQDDSWLPEKLSTLQEAMENSGAILVCSDMYVIDENGKQLADSISKIRRRIQLQSGDDLASGLIFHNFVTGCTMMIRAQDAKAFTPFCPYYVHDQYLAIRCADKGAILSVRQPLIRYRIHGNNQTAALSGVHDKRSYEEKRIQTTWQRLTWLNENVPMSDALRETVKNGVVWAEARRKNWNHQGGRKVVWKYRNYSPIPSLFELTCNWLPEVLFKKFLNIGKKL